MGKNTKIRLIYLLIFTLIVIVISISYFKFIKPVKTIKEYYNTIKYQDDIQQDLEISEKEISIIFACRDKYKNKKEDDTSSKYEDCLRSFYTEYTVENDPEKAFMHLAKVERTYPELLPGCHYISHGIGHGTLRSVGNDVGKAYSIMKNQNYFKNVATCGNGYFHGVIEEYAKNTKDIDGLIKLLKPVCNNPNTKNNCFHGVGHAATVQLDYDAMSALKVCDGLSADKVDLFGCHTGVFMEIGQMGIDDLFEVKAGKMVFKMCDNVDERYRPACYMEQSSYAEWFTKEPRNYTRNIGFCKQIKDDVNRMSCVKLNAIRAIRISRYEKIGEMCKNTSSRAESIMCTAILADRVGGSMDKTYKTVEYRQAVNDVCKTLPFYNQIYCEALAFDSKYRLFYTSERDLKMSDVSKDRLKDFISIQ